MMAAHIGHALLSFICASIVLRETAGNGGGGGVVRRACINGADQALTPSGMKRVDQLKLDDYVAVARDRFEPIITFLHRDGTRNARGFRFTTTNGTSLTLSDDHLVFIGPNKRAVLAKNIKIGDALYVAKNRNHVEEVVTTIGRQELIGRYSPLTRSGVILVNHVLVSCYSHVEDHHLMHRIVSWLMPFMFSESVFGTKGLLSNGDGIHWLGESLWYDLRHWFIATGSS